MHLRRGATSAQYLGASGHDDPLRFTIPVDVHHGGTAELPEIGTESRHGNGAVDGKRDGRRIGGCGTFGAGRIAGCAGGRFTGIAAGDQRRPDGEQQQADKAHPPRLG